MDYLDRGKSGYRDDGQKMGLGEKDCGQDQRNVSGDEEEEIGVGDIQLVDLRGFRDGMQ